MICPKCHNIFDLPANFCPNCGASIQRGGGRILIVTAAAVLVLIIGAYGYVKYQLAQGPGAARWPSPDQSQVPKTPQPAELAQQRTEASSEPSLAIQTAELILTDISGRTLANAPVAVLSPGWFAIPSRTGIGAYTWQVAMPSGRLLEVEGGILHDAAPVGLWQLPVTASMGETALMPWSPGRPLAWQPLDSLQAAQPVRVRNAENLTDFIRIPFDGDGESPGVFVQDGQVVGWSFGDMMPGGYLWTGNHGADLVAEFYPDDYYRLTFAGGMEEAFLLALVDENLSDLQRLENLVAAHRLDPRLTPSETPEHLAPAAIHAIMRNLIIRLESQGQAEDLVALLDPQTILAIDDASLTAELLQVASDLGAYAYATELIETLLEANRVKPEQRRRLQKIQAGLYRDWLRQLIADGDAYGARTVHRDATDLFPKDPAIHLAAVELSLLDQDWAQAEMLLAAQTYPPELRDTVGRLEQEISALKSQAGKIVIRFRPGSRTIPAVARLARGLDQRFVIDTGASIVTVPTATARRLGIEITNSLPRRLFYSATGVQHAVEITLPFIELNGWVVENVNALVVDLPGNAEVGLLGMNYLNNFRMDVNTSEGTLLLEPR